MRSKRRIVALIMSAGLVITASQGIDVPVYADPAEDLVIVGSEEMSLPEETELPEDIVLPEWNEDEIKGGEYVPGDVIVCVDDETDGDHVNTSGDDAEMMSLYDPVQQLLDSAEELMDVTEAVRLSTATDEDMPAPGESNDSALPESEGYSLKFIHSDSFSTEQMLDMLGDARGVVFAEPNYIYHISDDNDVICDSESLLDEEGLLPDEEVQAEPECIDEEYINGSDVLGSDDLSVMEVGGQASSDTAAAGQDITGAQYAYGSGEGGIEVPDWNNVTNKNAENTIVAVLDTGVDYTHPDLKDVMWDDGLKYEALVKLGGGRYGYCAMDKNSSGLKYYSDDPRDDHSHGTHCAGVIGAAWDGTGVSGAANGTKIMAVKAANDKGKLPVDSVIKGFRYIKTAREAGVKINAVNNSWGGSCDSYSVQLAVRELSELNIVSCFAAGNDGEDNDYLMNKVSALRENTSVIAVASNDKKGNKSSFSNYGIRTTDVSSPGSSILSSVMVDGGKVTADSKEPVSDISGNKVKDDFSGGLYFSYGSYPPAKANIGSHGSGRALRIKGHTDKAYCLHIRGQKLYSVPEYLLLKPECSTDDVIELVVVARALDNSARLAGTIHYLSKADGQLTYAFKLPKDMDRDNPDIYLFLAYNPDRKAEAAAAEIYINEISFADDVSQDYSILSGTSMATPAVTGEVAILASKWSNDDSERLAARVVGSTKYVPALENTSRTNGIVNVRKALECDYVPVVEEARVDQSGKLVISGYFFGSGKGSVSVTGTNMNISKTITGEDIAWQGAESSQWRVDGVKGRDVITADLGTDVSGNRIKPAGELKIDVTSQDLRHGSRYLEVKGADETKKQELFYRSIPFSVSANLMTGFKRTELYSGAALGDAIYYTGEAFSAAGEEITWKYVLPSGSNAAGVLSKLEKPLKAGGYSNICAWNGMLVYFDKETWELKCFDPKGGTICDAGISLYPLTPYVDYYCILNAGGTLYLFLTVEEYNSGHELQTAGTDIYELDLVNSRAIKRCRLRGFNTKPVLSADVDANGRGKMYALTATNNTLGRVEIEVDSVALKEGGKIDTAAAGKQKILMPEGVVLDKTNFMGCGNAYGIVMTGLANSADGTDNYIYRYDDQTVKPGEKQIIAGLPGATRAVSYKGNTYFLAMDNYTDGGYVMACAGDSEFRMDKPEKQPLHEFGDDTTVVLNSKPQTVELTGTGGGRLAVGRRVRLTPSVVKVDGKKVGYGWYSDSATIASVDQSGNVTGKCAGETVIRAIGKDHNGKLYTGEFAVTVYSPITGVKLNMTKLSTAAGIPFELEAAAYPETASGSDIDWEITVPEGYKGKITRTKISCANNTCKAVFTPENTDQTVKLKITAKATDGSNKKAVCTVTVGKAVSSLKLKRGREIVKDGSELKLRAGKTLSLTAVAGPVGAINRSVTWSTTDEEVATVQNGRVKAVGAGKVIITATANDGSGVSTKCYVNVTAPVTGAALSDTGTIKLGVGMKHDIQIVNIKPALPSAYNIKWQSSAPGIVSVSANGMNKAVIISKQAGTAKIKAIITNEAQSGKKQITTNVLTVKVVQSSVSANSIRIYKGKNDVTGKTERLAVKKSASFKAYTYVDGTAVKNTAVVWESADPEIATVNNGKIIAKKEGMVKITAKFIPAEAVKTEGFIYREASLNVYVFNPVKQLYILKGDVPVKKLTAASGEALKLSYEYMVEDIKRGDIKRENKKFTWTSSNPAVVETVPVKDDKNESYDVNLVMKAKGSAVITLKADDGSGRTAKCRVTVLGKVKGVTIGIKKPGNLTVSGNNTAEMSVSGLALKKSFTISPVINPASATNKTVIYRSTNDSVVTVNKGGTIKRTGAGTADVYVTTVDGGYKAICHVRD